MIDLKKVLIIGLLFGILLTLIGCGSNRSDQGAEAKLANNEQQEHNIDNDEEKAKEKKKVNIPSIDLSDDAKSIFDEHIYKDSNTIRTDLSKEKIKNNEPINIVVTSYLEKEVSLALVSVDINDEALKVTHIPTDIKTSYVQKNGGDDVLAAILMGYEAGAVRDILDIEVDYSITVALDELEELVDQIDSITVHNEYAFETDEYFFEEGSIDLNGDQMQHFIGNHSNHITDDFIHENYEKVIGAIIENILQNDTTEKLESAIEIMQKYPFGLETNFDREDIKTLFDTYQLLDKEVNSYLIQGKSVKTSEGYDYLDVSEEEYEKVREMLGKNGARLEIADDRQDLEEGMIKEFGYPVKPENSLTYVNETYGFSLKLPKSWEGQYFVQEIEPTDTPIWPQKPSRLIMFSMAEAGKNMGGIFTLAIFEEMSQVEVEAYFADGPGFEVPVDTTGQDFSMAYSRPGQMNEELYSEPYFEVGNKLSKMVEIDLPNVIETIEFR